MPADNLVNRLLGGRAGAGPGLKVHLSEREGADPHHKMRQAYWWIVNNAILCPYYDVEFGTGAELENKAGDRLLLHGWNEREKLIPFDSPRIGNADTPGD